MTKRLLFALKKWIVIWVFLVAGKVCFAQKDLIFNELTSQNGLEDTRVAFVFKDSRGFTWIGTLGSLYKFDGVEVSNYGASKGMDESYLQSTMMEDKRGNLWFCAYNKLFCYERLRDTCLSFGGFQEKNGEETLADYGLIHLDSKDQLWLTAGGKIFQLNLQQTLKNHKLNYKTISTEKKIVEGKRFLPLLNPNQEFIGFFEYFLIGSGMKIWTRESATQFRSTTIFDEQDTRNPPLKVNQVLPLNFHQDNFLICTITGVWSFNLKTQKLLKFKEAPSNNRFYSAIYIQANLLLCCTADGLYYLNIKTKDYNKVKDRSAYLNANSISRENLRDLVLDRDGILWGIAYDEGLCYSNPNQVLAEFCELDFKAECWKAIKQDEWLIGTINGFYLSKNRKLVAHFLNERILSFYQDPEKNLIWVLGGKGIYTYDPDLKQVKKVLDDQSFPFGFFRSSDGIYWVGSAQDVKKFNPATGIKTDINPETKQLLGSKNIWEDKLNRRLYLHENASNLHIFQYRNQTWEHDTVYSIKGDLGGFLIPKGSDKVWIATVQGIKLIHRTKGIMESLPLPASWPGNNISGMIQDQNGVIWVSTNTHVLNFSPLGTPQHIFTSAEGFLAAPFQTGSMELLKDNSIAILGRNGINQFYPANLTGRHNVPNIQLTRLLVKGTAYQKVFPKDSSILEKKYIRLKYRQNSVALRLVGIEMGQPGAVKIQYYLDGWEKPRETAIGNQFSEPFYNNLGPGKYTLMIRAANANGEWTNWIKKLVIEITPPFWMRWWFIMLAFIFIILAIAGSVRWYFRAQLREARIRNEEQERILQDIHDLTSGKVVFFQDFQSFAQKEIKNPDAQAKALNIAGQALLLFKRISAAVRNNTESDSTLIEFIHQLVGESKKIIDEKLSCSTQLEPGIPYAWVAGTYKNQLRLVVQESLGNVLKHALATEVLIKIGVKEGKLHICIQDNGKGIPEAILSRIKPTEKIQESGNGLGNMLARMQQIGGGINWSNLNGTIVNISISLQKIRPKRSLFPNFVKKRAFKI